MTISLVKYTRSGCKLSGDMAELVFQLRAYESGLVVSKPFGDNAPYDFLVDSGDVITRVQVKSTTNNISKTGVKYKFNAVVTGGKVPIRPDHIDVLAAYIHSEDVWYIIPVEALRGCCTFAVNPRDNTDRFSEYKDAWRLFLKVRGKRRGRPVVVHPSLKPAA